MAFNPFHSIVFRGSSVNDPENTAAAGFVEVEVAAKEIDFWPDLTGETETDGNGQMYTLYGAREIGNISLPRFTKGTNDGSAMDGGRIRKLQLLVFTSRYYWIYRVRLANGLGTVPRADFDHTNPASEISADSLWNLSTATPPGQLPMRVVVERGSRPEPLGSGWFEWNFKLFKATKEVF